MVSYSTIVFFKVINGSRSISLQLLFFLPFMFMFTESRSLILLLLLLLLLLLFELTMEMTLSTVLAAIDAKARNWKGENDEDFGQRRS